MSIWDFWNNENNEKQSLFEKQPSHTIICMYIVIMNQSDWMHLQHFNEQTRINFIVLPNKADAKGQSISTNNLTWSIWRWSSMNLYTLYDNHLNRKLCYT